MIHNIIIIGEDEEDKSGRLEKKTEERGKRSLSLIEWE